MSSLPFAPALHALPKGVLVGGAAVVVFVLLWLWALLSRRRHVTIGESESIRMAIVQLGRIADSLERISFALEIKATTEGKDAGRTTVSLLEH